jgi:hypothetical protein
MLPTPSKVGAHAGLRRATGRLWSTGIEATALVHKFENSLAAPPGPAENGGMDTDSAGPTLGATAPPASHTGGHPLALLVRHLESDLKDCRDVDPIYLSPGERADALLRLGAAMDQLTAVQLRLVTSSEDVAREDGHKSIAAWLAAQRHTSYGEEAGALRLAEALDRRWVATRQALMDGDVNVAQARVISRILDDLGEALEETESEADGPLTIAHPEHPDDRSMRVVVTSAQLLTMAEEALLAHSATLGPKDLRTLGERILTKVCPEVADEAERRALERAERRASAATTLSISNRGDGSADIRGRIPAASATLLRTILDGYTAPRHDAMTMDTGERGSDARDAATGTKLPHDRRLGNAFVAFLENVDPGRLPTQGGSPTKMVVTMRLTDLVSGLGSALLPDGSRISAGQARRLACSADLVPAILGTESEVLDLGRSARLFSPAQRLAKMTEMRLEGITTCQADGCCTALEHSEAHHRRDTWAEGGTTDREDLDFLCPWHHHRVHDPAYVHIRMADGSYRFHRRT